MNSRRSKAAKPESVQARLQPRKAPSTSSWWRASRARRPVSAKARSAASMAARLSGSRKKCGANQAKRGQPRIGHGACVDRGDGRAVAVPDERKARSAERIENARQSLDRLSRHVVERAGQGDRRRAAIATPRPREHAAAGRLGQLLRVRAQKEAGRPQQERQNRFRGHFGTRQTRVRRQRRRLRALA